MAWVEQRGSRYRVRIRMPDGSVGTDSCHPTRAIAELRSKQVDVEQALDTYLDPARGRITLAEWVAIWEPGHLAGEAKWAAYRSHLRNHILPRFRDVPLTKISRQSVKVFVKQPKTHLADSTTASVMSLLSLPMPEARDSARDIHLPPFLITLLREVLDSHDHDTVFCGARGAFLRRSAMSRRVWGPAVNGNPHKAIAPIIDGMHFHDLRHTHKTWLRGHGSSGHGTH